MSANREGPGAKLSPQASLWLAVAAAITGFAAVYGTLGGSDNGTGALKAAPDAQKAASAPSSGEATAGKLAAFVRKNPPVALAEFSFTDGTGKTRTLADFSGKTVLLNLWATWCAPCREEMPSLDRLQKELGSDTFEVVALAVDRTGVEAAGKFLKSIGVEHLKLYADPTTKSGTALRVLGMPTTILVTADGKEAGRLAGPAAWDSDEAKKLIAAARQ
ncbi:MAG: redoxin family protein [Hyphomicrobium sp.]